MVLSSILAISLARQASTVISSNPSNNVSILARGGDVVNFEGTIEFMGDSKVLNSSNVVKTLNIRLWEIFLMPQKANWFSRFTLVDAKGKTFEACIEKMKPMVNGRGSNQAYGEFFLYEQDFRTFDSGLKRSYNPKKSVAFFIPIAAFGVLPQITFYNDRPEGFTVPQYDPNTGKPAADNPFFAASGNPVRGVKLTLWPTFVHPRNFTMTIVKPTPVFSTNQVGFTMFDTLKVKKTIKQFDKNGKQEGATYGPVDETITPDELSYSFVYSEGGPCIGQRLLGMKVGEIREITVKHKDGSSEVTGYELVSVVKG